jgi:hypothetical protein
MKKLTVIIAALIFLLSACQGSNNKEDNSNMKKGNKSSLFYQNISAVSGADPFVLYCKEGKYEGNFFMYVTSGDLNTKGFNVYRSKDLTNWQKADVAFMPDGASWGNTKLWAPEVVEEQGTYYMFYSAQWGEMKYGLYISVAVSNSPTGPFVEYSSDNKSVMEPLIQFEKHINEIPEHLRSGLTGYNGQKGFIKVIDGSPFVDPLTGKKYLYLIADIGTDYTPESFVMVMEMQDWLTPKYETLTRITEYGKTEVDGLEVIVEGGKTNEGCSVHYHDGIYYLTFSTFTYYTSEYQVRQAISESPLGPFTKIDPKDGGTVISTEAEYIRQSAGHSAFFTVGDELWISYHSFFNDKDIQEGRKPAVDRIVFVENSKGQKVMQANGPTVTPQYMPKALTGYGNIALEATVSCNNNVDGYNVDLLNDGFIPLHRNIFVPEFTVNSGKSEIIFTFNETRRVKAVIIYNSIYEDKRFDKIKSVVISGEKKLKFKDEVFDASLYEQNGKIAFDQAIIITFEEMEANSITVTIDTKYTAGIPEIVILGK